VLAVDNSDLTLRPGMTATAEIITATRENVLLVPNAALRFTPPAAAPGADNAKQGKSLVGSLVPRPPQGPPRKATTPKAPASTVQRVWILKDGAPASLRIVTGATNGRHTEVVDGELEPGMAVITELLTAGR
jgi:HlyD family secretion protein